MAFYEDLGDGRFRSTSSTAGPWSEQFQHGGPPSALLGRAVESLDPDPDQMVARFTVEILGPVPVADLTVTAEVVRPGKKVELVHAVLSHEGRPVVRAAAWRVRRAVGVSVPSRHPVAPALPGTAADVTGHGWSEGYLQAMEWRWAAGGGITVPGPSTAWARMRVPLVDDEQPSGLCRVLTLADSGSGVSSELSITEWQFINPELTIHLHREAVGEWICLDAATTIHDGGVGLATSTLSDLHGPVGVGAQSLLVNRWS